MAKARTTPTRFVTRREAKVEKLPWGPHHWICRPDIVPAEQLLVVRVHMPSGKGHEFHRHPAMEEVIYVLEGKAEQWVDGEKRVLREGEAAHIPRDVVHATYNAGKGVLRFLAILGPADFRGPALVDMAADMAWKGRRNPARRSAARRGKKTD